MREGENMNEDATKTAEAIKAWAHDARASLASLAANVGARMDLLGARLATLASLSFAVATIPVHDCREVGPQVTAGDTGERLACVVCGAECKSGEP